MSVDPWPAMPGALVVARFAQIQGDSSADYAPEATPSGTPLRALEEPA